MSFQEDNNIVRNSQEVRDGYGCGFGGINGDGYGMGDGGCDDYGYSGDYDGLGYGYDLGYDDGDGSSRFLKKEW
jgi:hypothetical protein